MYSIDVIIMYTVQKQKYVLSNPNCSAEPTGLCRVVIVGSIGGNVLLMVVVSSKCPFFMGSCEFAWGGNLPKLHVWPLRQEASGILHNKKGN